MPQAYIQPGESLTVPGWVPRTGVVGFHVVSSLPVTTYVVNEDAYNHFRFGEPFTYYGGFTQETQHVGQVRVPFLGAWHLIIYNPNPYVVGVGYSIW